MANDKTEIVQMQPDELLSFFVNRNNPSFDAILKLVKDRMTFAMSKRQRATPSLLPTALYMVLSEHGVPINVPKICELLELKSSAIYQRAYTIKELLKTSTGIVAPSQPVMVAPEPLKIHEVIDNAVPTVESLKTDIGASSIVLQRERESRIKEIDSINAIGLRIKEIESQIDTHAQIKSINEKLDILAEILTKQTQPTIPIVEEPIPFNIITPQDEKKEIKPTKHLILADFNTILNYSIMTKEKGAIEATIEAISKSVSAEGAPFDLMVYIYVSGNFLSKKKEIKTKLHEKLLQLPGSQINKISAFHTDERKGERKNGNRKFQDVDGFIIDKACEKIILEKKEIKVVHLVSGDIDMIPIVWRARKAGMRVKLIAYEDTLSERMHCDAGSGSFVRII